MLIEIHILQNHSPSNLNRDDTGSPKDAFFGGFKRARISSQCIKRSIRKGVSFSTPLEDYIGQRTRKMPVYVKEKLMKEHGIEEMQAQAIAEQLVDIGKSDKKEKKKKEKVKLETQLIFFDRAELDAMVEKSAELCKGEDLDKLTSSQLNDQLKPIMDDVQRRSVDLALFGRMTTGDFLEDVEASMQVAHAIGTAKMDNEYDFFTAVDDLNVGGDTMEEHGAGHIGDVEFTSTTYYKYFNCDFNELQKNLGGDRDLTEKTIHSFIRAAALSSPTGKQNTFASHHIPDVLYIEIKEQKIPLSYANAFVKPVLANHKRSLTEVSADALMSYIAQVKTAYPIPTTTGYLTLVKDFKPDGKECKSIDVLADWVIQEIQQMDKASQ
ncbi:MAG TPA: type I-E CRISPR-associated protein Cas7/Cse4/CasC [Spirochaetes bacterium]|nr:type I-E CRISPR-associated protein Cas7/Cse4/CasC [Spirochaetota bacterium]